MHDQRIGFIGIGVMGLPMALNLLRGGTKLVVWNRSPEKCESLCALGAVVEKSSDALFANVDVVILMLAHGEAMDDVLKRDEAHFKKRIGGKTIISMGTFSAEYSEHLDKDISAAGGRYVECPVSGSRRPAELGDLVGMIAGEQAEIEKVTPLLKSMCREIFVCGTVPSATLMKLSVNLFLITMVTGLCEAFHYADKHGLDTGLFQAILDAGPMASNVSRLKLPKLVSGDFSVQASIADVLKNNRLVAEEARRAVLASPLLDQCHALFSETLALGHGALDMAAVVKAIEARTELVR